MNATQTADFAAIGEGTDILAIATLLKGAMRYLPSGVAIVTARDPATAQPAGMAVSSLVSVSMDPPTMLFAVNRASGNHTVFERSDRFCINLLSMANRDEVAVFASSARRAERFTGSGWSERYGLDCLHDATAIFCTKHASMIVGTHEIFVGEVFAIDPGLVDQPLGWMNGGFHEMRSV